MNLFLESLWESNQILLFYIMETVQNTLKSNPIFQGPKHNMFSVSDTRIRTVLKSSLA